MLRFFLSAAFLLTGFYASAQNPALLKKEAEKAIAAQNWAHALSLLEQYQSVRPGELDILTRLGICHYQLHHADKALEYFDYVRSRNPKKPDPDLFYYQARTLHGLSRFDAAAETYKQFLRIADSRHPLRANTRDNIRRCLSGSALSPNPAIALVENMGAAINTAGDEFAPLPSINHPDRLYYTAARPGCQGGRRNEQGYEDTLTGRWCSDMFFAQRLTTGWEQGGDLGTLINSPRHEVALAFGQSGSILYYFRGFTLYAGEILADTADSRDEYTLQPPGFLSPVDGRAGDAGIFFLNDTNMLFASRRPGGYGGLDLYLTRLSDGQWSEPQNLGPEINSPYDETTPFLAKDGLTLYFSSNRTESMGGLDVFRSVYDTEKTVWTMPVNYGPPVNSPGDDAFFRISADGLTACLSSDRLDSYGQRDLYIVYYKAGQPEQTAGATRLFADLQRDEALAAAATGPKSATIPVLYYINDQDIQNPANLEAITAAANAWKLAPGSTILVAAHTNESGPVKFDLYFGIKRAETVGQLLLERGVPADKIFLKSAGPFFPAARTVVGAEPYPAGDDFNRRIELELRLTDGEIPFDIVRRQRDIPAAAIAGGGARWDQQAAGLAFRVELALTRSILTDDAILMYDNLLIESYPGSGAYRYTAGYFEQYADALQLQKELKANGYPNAIVTAYCNGIRISKAEAVRLLKKYPELAAFIRSQG